MNSVHNLDTSRLQKIATRLAYIHAILLVLHILYNYLKKRKDFRGTSATYRYKVILLHFNTHFGNNRDFWFPFFERCVGRKSSKYLRFDDELWDIVIPIGNHALEKVRKRMLGHAHPFVFPLPDLYKMPPYTKPNR